MSIMTFTTIEGFAQLLSERPLPTGTKCYHSLQKRSDSIFR